MARWWAETGAKENRKLNHDGADHTQLYPGTILLKQIEERALIQKKKKKKKKKNQSTANSQLGDSNKYPNICITHNVLG